MFLADVNDIPEGMRSYFSKFTDDTALMAEIGHVRDCEILQGDLNALAAWQDRWMLKANLSKCRVLRMGRGSGQPLWNYRLAG